MNNYQQKDLEYIWHPCAQMKDYQELPPVVIEKGNGCTLYDVDGNKYIDCISSWWTNVFGHSNKRINAALIKQIESIEHVIFANFSNKPAIELAERLVKITPEKLKKVYFSDNGSSAVEIALKMSFQYHQQNGSTSKTKFVAISDAYHGETIGALSLGDLDLYSKIYKPLLMDTFKVQGPDCYRCPYNKNRECCNCECFEHMENLFSKHHSEICSVIIEPMVQGAGGMKIYPKEYLNKLRKLCDNYDIHLIADEIAVGFGRTGKMFACEHPDISPDIMCLSKALSSGYMPMSIVMTSEEIYNAFYGEYTELKAFIHSHTYAGNAMASAIACENLNIFDDDNIIEKNKTTGLYIKNKTIENAKSHPYVGEVRSIGMITAIELVKNKNTKISFPWQNRVGYEIYKIALKKGLLIRPIGNVLYFMPPYIITKKEINYMVDTSFECINEYFNLK